MAVAKLVCGDCGADLAPGDRQCPGCGAALERDARSSGTTVRCPACGHLNTPPAETCQSCGGRLGARTGTKPASTPKQNAATARRKFESWHIFSGAAVLVLVAYLVYSNIDGGTPAGASAGSRALPTGEGPVTPHVHAIDLAPLEAAVRARPDDPDALLKLANALHDNSLWARAIEAYGRYLQKNPGNPDARVDLGICYFELSRIDSAQSGTLARRAVQEMESAATQFPNHQQAAFNLGIVLLNTGDLAGSNRWFSRAVEINSQSELGQQAKKILSQHSTLTP